MKTIAVMCVVLLAADLGPFAELCQAIRNKDCPALDAALQKVKREDRKKAIASVRRELTDADAGVRGLAVYALTQIDADEAKGSVAALVEAFADPEARVRARMTIALGELGDAAQEALPALVAATRDPDPRVRAGAARALGRIRTRAADAVPVLIEALKDRVPPVRGQAARALGELGPAAKDAVARLKELQAKDDDEDVRTVALSALKAIDPSTGAALEAIEPPVSTLRRELLTGNDTQRLLAASILAKKGGEAREALPTLMHVVANDPMPEVRAAVVFTLGRIGPEAREAAPAIITALKDPNVRVRSSAALALGLIGSEAQGAGAALAEALKDPNPEVANVAATSIANLGPGAEAALPELIALARNPDVVLRRRAINVLARVGPGAKITRSILCEALTDRDEGVRHDAIRALISVGPQPDAPLPVLIDALGWKGSELDPHVRAWACLSLAQAGPAAAEAAPRLIAALQDPEEAVRVGAIFALGRLGPQAVPDVVRALEDIHPQVRAGAAQALGNAGTGGRRAIPKLVEALHDEDATVCLAVAEALARIARELQAAQDVHSLSVLEEVVHALESTPLPSLTPAQQAEWKAAVDGVRTARWGLRSIARGRFYDQMLHHSCSPWLAGAALYLGGALSLWLLLLWRRPLTLLRINETLRPLPHIRLPALLGNLELSFRGLLLVRLFHYHPRVLDAWVRQYACIFRENFEARRTVNERRIYIPVPAEVDGAVVADAGAAELGRAFARRRGCLLIWGEGGIGKTTLACRLGHLALAAEPAERLCRHLMLPVLIEHELDLKTTEGQQPYASLVEAVRGQLQALIGDGTPMPGELLEQLLRQRRILVIVDHLSEIPAAAREAVRPGQADFPAHALVITSRTEDALDDVPRVVVRPLPVGGNRLSAFLEAYLVHRGQRERFDDAQVFDACRRLSMLAGGREVTAQFVAGYAERMIAGQQAGRAA